MLRRAIVAGIVLAGCSAAPAPDPTPPPLPPPDETPDAPPMIPDPVAALPEPGLTVTPRRDTVTAQQLVAEGLAARRRDGDSAALDLFHAATAADPLEPSAWWEVGWSLQQLGRWEDALEAWRTLSRLDPTHPGPARYVPIVTMRRDRARIRSALGPAAALQPEETPRPGERLTIAAVGDIQMGQGWPPDAVRLPPDSGRALFAGVGHALRRADLAFGNLETALADSGASRKCRPSSANCYAFRAPTAYAGTLRAAGFELLSVNNNHTGDFGDAGRRSTAAALDAASIRHSGPTSGVASLERRGVRIAMIAFGTGDGPYLVTDLDAARRTVADADRDHDLVIVSFHAGAEGADKLNVPKRIETAYGENRGDVFAFARAVVDAGADLVLGHGPHVLRGMEVYRGRLIAYSLGNFSSWHGFNLRGNLGVSAILEVSLAPNGVATAARIHPLVLAPPGVPGPDPEGAAIGLIRTLSRDDFGDPLFDPSGRWARGGSPP